MSLRKLCLFTLAAAIAAFGAVGTLTVQIKEYEVPTPESRPHDPAFAPDGSLWYTGQGANKLGRLHPSRHEHQPEANRDCYRLRSFSKNLITMAEHLHTATEHARLE